MRLFLFGVMMLVGLSVGCTPPPAEPKKVPAKMEPFPDEAPAEEGADAEMPAEIGEEAPSTEATPTADDTSGSTSAVERTGTMFTSVSLKVPTMSCPVGCWPTVKETLEKQTGVKGVELAKQSDPNSIDNPVVIVSSTNDFDADAAIAALAAVDFSGAEVVAK